VVAVIDAPEVEEQYQQAVSDYKIKKLTYERLAKVWKESPDVIAKQDVDVAEAAYQGARHLMEQRVVMRDYTKVRAPYDGIVTARFADPGSLIQIATSSAASAIPPLYSHGPQHGPRLCERPAGRQPLGRSRQNQRDREGHGTAQPVVQRCRDPLHPGT
jgi:multidrug resistance efflux pump